MHGIFFGSNDEIEFAHNEGFLLELFRDTGFYNYTSNETNKFLSHKQQTNITSSKNNLTSTINNNYNTANFFNTSNTFGTEDIEDVEDLFKSIENTYYELTINEEEFANAIDKIIDTNANENNVNNIKFKSFSNIDNFKKTKFFRNISSESFLNEINNVSETPSSLLSFNKDSYCRNYINNTNNNNNNAEFSSKKNIDIDLKKLISNARFDIVNNKQIINRENCLNENSEINSSNNMKRLTPRGDVLATINTWLTKTKDAIKTRNLQMAKKNSI